MDNCILVKRDGACGDVLLATSILPALKKHHPDASIFFETKCSSVLVGNPHVDYIVSRPPAYDYKIVVDLNMAYENRPNTHILTCFAEAANVPLGWCSPYVTKIAVNKPLMKNYVVIHAGNTNWAGRNWGEEQWKDIALKFHNKGYQIICVGKRPDRFVPCDVDCRDITSVGELATIIKDAKLFVGIDSLPFHIAQIVGTPCVTFFGSINPNLRIFSPLVKPVMAKELTCLGCHHRQPVPSFTLGSCPLGTYSCEKNVSVEQMWEAIKEQILTFNT